MNGASSSHFEENSDGKVPLELANNKDVLKTILIDFFSPTFDKSEISSTKLLEKFEFKPNSFWLKPVFGDKNIMQYICSMDKREEREEMIHLLLRLDNIKHPDSEDVKSKRRVIEILREGINPSKGLRDALDSLKAKFPWGKSKFWMMFLFIVGIKIFGIFAYVLDVGSDINFCYEIFNNQTSTIITENQHEQSVLWIVSLLHIIKPFILGFFALGIMLTNGVIKWSQILLFFPIPVLCQKIYNMYLEYKICENKTKRDTEKRDAKLMIKKENASNLLNLALILEAGAESSFQVRFTIFTRNLIFGSDRSPRCQDVCVSVCVSVHVTFFKKGLLKELLQRGSSRESSRGSKQAGKQAGKQVGKQAGKHEEDIQSEPCP